MSVQRIVCKTNEEWRTERAKSIGASSIATLMGENPWQTPMELAERMKAELAGNFDYTQTLPMMRGHAYEQGVADLFTWSTGKQLIKASNSEFILRRDDLPFMHASPDRTYWIFPDGPKVGDKAELNKGILECKTTRRPVNPEDLPLSWQFQLQMQMGVGGYIEGYIAWDVLSQADGFGYHRYEFVPEVFDAIVEVCRAYWYDCIIGNNVPDPVNARDITRRWPESVDGKVRTVGSDIRDVCAAIKAKEEERKEIEAEIEELKERVKMSFEDDEAISDTFGNLLATYKSSAGRTTIDSKLLKQKFPTAYAECCKVGKPSRTLRIK